MKAAQCLSGQSPQFKQTAKEVDASISHNSSPGELLYAQRPTLFIEKLENNKIGMFGNLSKVGVTGEWCLSSTISEGPINHYGWQKGSFAVGHVQGYVGGETWLSFQKRVKKILFTWLHLTAFVLKIVTKILDHDVGTNVVTSNR